LIIGAAAALVSPSALAEVNNYRQTNLIANKAIYNPTVMIDPNVRNPWGIALRPPGQGGHIWLSNAQTGTTTTYVGDVNGIPLQQDGLKVIPIVAPPEDPPGYSQTIGEVYHATVTGQVYNAASDIPGQPTEFFVSGAANNWSTTPPTPVGNISGSAKFVFVTTDGTINAWRSGTNPGMQEAVIVKDYSAQTGIDLGLEYSPGYVGVAMTTDAFTLDSGGNKVADNRLYAADFSNNRIQVFDNQWNDITASVPFERPADMRGDYHPFNVQYIEGRVYVAYAQTSFELDDPTEEVNLPASGRVVVYDRDGHMLQNFSDQSIVNAPWGVAIAPSTFGAYGGDLLVANFGDGTIAAYDVETGAAKGYLNDSAGNPISIDGLWGISFGNGVSLGDANSLYFTAGPAGEQDGIFGKLTLTTIPGDADGDGTVNTLDFNVLAGQFGQNLSGFQNGDFDGDAVVGSIDFNLLIANFGRSQSSLGVVVPEPTSFGMLLAGAGALGMLRRRR